MKTLQIRRLCPDSPELLREEIERIDVEKAGVRIMLPKGEFHILKIEGITCAAGNILKQEMLSRGGEAVISRFVYRLKEGSTTDAILMGTSAHYRALIPKLRMQPIKNLLELADRLETVLLAKTPRKSTKIGSKTFPWGTRTFIMGIINMTPDSFSGGSHGKNVAEAIRETMEFIENGADIIDIGGESTRPGGEHVAEQEELDRVIPLIGAIRKKTAIPISVDTYKASVAKAAVEAGADMVNDVWGFKKDPEISKIVGQLQVPVCLVHNRQKPEEAVHSEVVGGFYSGAHYTDLMGEVLRELGECIELAEAANVSCDNIIIDPGIGFGKTPEQNLHLMRRLKEFQSLGCPILLGTSRKSFIGKILDRPPAERVFGTAATTAIGIIAGADIIRVHDVTEMVQVAKITDAILRA